MEAGAWAGAGASAAAGPLAAVASSATWLGGSLAFTVLTVIGLIGSAAGLALGILGSRVLASIVYQATPRDPLVLAGVVLAMAFLGLLATWIPAQRALSVDPLTLLREE